MQDIYVKMQEISHVVINNLQVNIIISHVGHKYLAYLADLNKSHVIMIILFVDINILHVNIINLHAYINKSHANIDKSHVILNFSPMMLDMGASKSLYPYKNQVLLKDL